ncbi:hypothetical protein CAEBREN_16150 [Caenorhabditis brenneri]|uniref:Uncharacterized protein n=1 Tax=Caenorhabditis brenneri TaxID=135651 RepID=G0P669_CAEBE|nr:hypothetical protein CAEBREN_16150 [Caenorhabditis brenneri]
MVSHFDNKTFGSLNIQTSQKDISKLLGTDHPGPSKHRYLVIQNFRPTERQKQFHTPSKTIRIHFIMFSYSEQVLQNPPSHQHVSVTSYPVLDAYDPLIWFAFFMLVILAVCVMIIIMYTCEFHYYSLQFQRYWARSNIFDWQSEHDLEMENPLDTSW